MKLFEKYFYMIPSLAVFVIYNFTLAPSVIQIDSGELAAVQATLGIAHPTGYPLFTIIGFLFLQIPLFESTIFQANFLAAIYCSISIGVFSKLISEIISYRNLAFDNNNLSFILVNITGSLVFGFSTTFWFQSTSVEVYSLHMLLIVFSLFALVKAHKSDDKKYWYLFAYSFGLALTNHMTSILIIPASVYLFFQKNKFSRQSFLFGIRLSLITSITSISIYSLLPILASQNPILNWGNPIDFEKFWRHFTGAQYQVWIFSSLEASKKQLSYFIQNIPNEFYYPSLLIIIIGVYELYRELKQLFVFTFLLFLTTVFYSINYDIVDIDSYFLLAYLSFSIFLVFGSLKTLSLFENGKVRLFVSLTLLFLLPFSQLLQNYEKVDQSNNYVFEDYTKASLNSLPQNSILLSYQWDYLISPPYNFQFVEKYREDVSLIDKELLRRSWYYDQLSNLDSSIFVGLKSEVTNFLSALKPFEQDKNFNPQVLEHYYRLILQKLITENSKRDFFIGIELFTNEMQTGEFALPKNYKIVPYLLSFKVTKETGYLAAPFPDFVLRIPNTSNKYIEFIKTNVCTMLQYRALYELQFDKLNNAEIYSRRIKEISPNFVLNENLIKLIY